MGEWEWQLRSFWPILSNSRSHRKGILPSLLTEPQRDNLWGNQQRDGVFIHVSGVNGIALPRKAFWRLPGVESAAVPK
jgi:hypothetical protein